MSTWYIVEDDNIDIEDDVAICVTSDDFGGVYVTLTFEQIESIYQKVQEERLK